MEFTNLHNLEHHFTDQATCWQALEAIRWEGKPICPFCASVTYYKIKGRNTLKCKDCKKHYNVLTGTIFENTKISLLIWFKAIYIATSHKKGISSIQLAKDLGITQKSSWFVLSRIRKLAEDKVPFMLAGLTAADETFIGGKTSNRHQSLKSRKLARPFDNKTPVLALLEKNGKLVNKVLKNANADQILPAIEKHIEKGSIVVTDHYNLYKQLPSLGYVHRTVNHTLHEYVLDGYTTNGVENYFSQIKRGIYGIYHQVSPKHLHRYCSEFVFRYNTRKLKESDRFHLALSQVDKTRLRYKDLIKKV